jgi:hypothetical protein
MGIDAQMFVRIPRLVTDEEVARWSYIFGSLCHHDLFLGTTEHIYHKPLERIDIYQQDGDDIIPKAGETFLNVPWAGRYYGEDYERGPLLTYIAGAEFLEALIPGCAVWYGGDSSGVLAEPFDKTRRRALLKHAAENGHDPYNRAFDSLSKDGFVEPECPICAVSMPRSGWGPAYAFFRCNGCGWEVRYRDTTKAAGFRLKDEFTVKPS